MYFTELKRQSSVETPLKQPHETRLLSDLNSKIEPQHLDNKHIVYSNTLLPHCGRKAGMLKALAASVTAAGPLDPSDLPTRAALATGSMQSAAE